MYILIKRGPPFHLKSIPLIEEHKRVKTLLFKYDKYVYETGNNNKIYQRR